MTVHSIRSPDKRYGYLFAGRHRRLIIGLDKIDPVLDGRVLVSTGHSASAVFDGADVILGYLLGFDGFPFWLNHLADFSFDAHLAEHPGDPFFYPGIKPQRRFRHRPHLWSTLTRGGPGPTTRKQKAADH